MGIKIRAGDSYMFSCPGKSKGRRTFVLGMKSVSENTHSTGLMAEQSNYTQKIIQGLDGVLAPNNNRTGFPRWEKMWETCNILHECS